jgi:multidrug efflux pump subunit AcrB
MSQERRRRRAQQRTQGHRTKQHHDPSEAHPRTGSTSRGATRNRLQQRKHSVVVALVVAVVAVNLVAWLFTDSWSHRLLLVILTVLAATVGYFLAINPAKSTGV